MPVPDSPPPWARYVAIALALLAVGIFVLGRGGTAVLLGVAAAFGAVAILLLSMPDRLPDEE